MPSNEELLDRMPPHNLEAERGVIGSVLLDPACIGKVSDILRPEDFHADAHARLFREVLAMDAARQPIDVVTLLNRLRVRGEIEAVGGAAYLVELSHAVPYAANAEYYARIVRDKALLRGLIHASTEAIRDAYDGGDEPTALLDRAEQRLLAIGGKRGSELSTAAQLAIEVGDFVDEVSERGKHLGIPTGFADMDSQIGGLFGGEFIVLASRPSVGKSALAAQIADYNARSGRMVYFASLEMTGRELAMRSICATKGVDSRTIRTNRMMDEDRRLLVEGIAEYGQTSLIVDTRAMVTVESLGRTVRRLIPNGLSLVVVDYLQLMTPSNPRAVRQEQVSYQTRALKLLAREIQIPVLVLCQLNRAATEDTGPPQLHHLRESGAIEQDADTVLLIHRPEEGIMISDPNGKKGAKMKADWPAELYVAKQRNGPTARFKLDWEACYTRFNCWGAQVHPEFAEFAPPEAF